jgi:predicted transport protein
VAEFKLFRIGTSMTAEIPGRSAQVEKSLQVLFEANLEPLIGVRFLATEFGTGKIHSGRIDTLGLDENNCPVIVEYKRAVNQNVINQGLFYLDWLMDHRGDFEMLVQKRLGTGVSVDWSAPRVVCVAADFTDFDKHAVRQIIKNIELMRYRHYGDDLLLLQLVHPSSAPPVGSAAAVSVDVAATTSGAPSLTDLPAGKDTYASKGIGHRLAHATQPIKDLFEALKAYLLALGDDVQIKQLKFFFAFRSIKNFACVEIYPQARKVVVFLKVDPDSVQLIPGMMRDMRKIGHYGTGDLEVTLRTMADFEQSQALLVKSYEAS